MTDVENLCEVCQRPVSYRCALPNCPQPLPPEGGETDDARDDSEWYEGTQ